MGYLLLFTYQYILHTAMLSMSNLVLQICMSLFGEEKVSEIQKKMLEIIFI